MSADIRSNFRQQFPPDRNPLTFPYFHANLKKVNRQTRGKREYICWNFTERFPTVFGQLRGDGQRQMEHGFGVAGMNLFAFDSRITGKQFECRQGKDKL